VGGLAHYFENEGLSTTQISLIRPHTEKIKPPRALWVSFDMGRPLGDPDDPAFQTRVLQAVFRLLDAKEGPVLVDFPEDAAYMTRDTLWACPVTFDPVDEDLSQEETLIKAFRAEMNQLRNWYDLALEKRGRTTVGVSGIDLENLADFISAFLTGPYPENPNPEFRLPHTLNLAVDDLKAFYTEAVTAQPGPTGSPDQIADWFYGQTAAGRLLYAIRDKGVTQKEDGFLRIVAGALLIPSNRPNPPEKK